MAELLKTLKNEKTMIKKYAFIDAQNTETTTRKLLGFIVDWKKLYLFLRKKWDCDKVFLYSGIDVGDTDTEKEFENLAKKGCVIKSKMIFAYKNKNKIIQLKCPKCENEFNEVIDMGYNRKSNCDVDLTVDAMECAKPDTEIYIFSGDGDFEYLIQKTVEKGAIVHIVSSAKKVRSGPRYFVSRFSTKLRNLIAEKRESVFFIEINDLKMRIKKEI